MGGKMIFLSKIANQLKKKKKLHIGLAKKEKKNAKLIFY
jgi:hypothetical protein